jgi:hypothetical protein
LLQAPLTPGLEYKWRLNGVNIPGATAASYTATAAGNYSCWMEKSGCSAVSNTLLVSTSMCYVTINLKAFIEGYYMGFSTLNAAIDPFNQPNDCDTLVLSLASSLSPNPILYSDTAILQIDGTAAFGFPAQASGGNYYLVLNHRNSIETWSSSPVLINPVTNYDFTVSATTAYGNNLVNLGDGNFAIYSGDISDQALGVGFKDDVIESQDYLDMENAVSLVFIGYVQEDITGDGVVESYDYAIMENNVSALVFTNRP